MMKMVFPVLGRDRRVDVALLGVTPEIANLPWPSHVTIRAFDHSATMIDAVWQPPSHGQSSVALARWQELPLPSRSLRAAVGDASLATLPSLVDYPDVLSELSRVLEPEGILCGRFFVRPNAPESMESIAEDIQRGRIRTFHAFKWRIAMALSRAPTYGVAVEEILGAFESTFPDRCELAKMTNWPMDVIQTIDAYRGTSTRLNFPTMQALTDAFAPWFRITEISIPDYELGPCCPTLCLQHADSVGENHTNS